MQKNSMNHDKQKQAGPPVDWHGLSNEPRNENLTKIREPGSFERQEIAREKEGESNSSYSFAKKRKKDARR